MSKLMMNTLGLGSVGIASYFWGRSLAPPSPTIPDPLQTPTKTQVGTYNKGGQVGSFDPSTIRPQDFFKYGFPGPNHDMGNHNEFISCYDRSTRNPYWVLEHVTADSLKRNEGVDRKKSVFREDETIPMKFRARLRDYFRSGYDRGHQAPAADAKFTQEAMNETFLLTNISPQVGEGFNRDYWAFFEDFCRRLAYKYTDVRIMTGPLYLPKLCDDDKYRVTYEVIGSPPNIAVPTHFFKLVVGENKGDDTISAAAFVLPNDKIDNNTPLTAFQVPIEALERSSGLDLLQQVPYLKKKDLCREVKCEIIVKEYNNQVNKLLPGK